MVPARSSRRGYLLNSDGNSVPLSGRNSTYRRVPILKASSHLAVELRTLNSAAKIFIEHPTMTRREFFATRLGAISHRPVSPVQTPVERSGNETPKSALGDRKPKRRFRRQFPHTETSQHLQNTAKEQYVFAPRLYFRSVFSCCSLAVFCRFGWSPCAEFGDGNASSASCLRGRILVSHFRTLYRSLDGADRSVGYGAQSGRKKFPPRHRGCSMKSSPQNRALKSTRGESWP